VSELPIRVGRDFRKQYPNARPSSTEAAANLVRTSTMLVAEIDRRRAGIAPLSASAFQALAILDGADEPLPSSVIADRLLVTTASMTSLLDTLTRRGLIERRPHPTDRRKILVQITPSAKRIVADMLPVVYDTQHEVLGVLTETERRSLVELLARIQARLTELA
jgi:DNA-binding MarR family transcriptional regulator